MLTVLPDWVLIFVALIGLWPVLGWIAVRYLSGVLRSLVLLVSLAISLGACFLVPPELPWLRFVLLVPSFVVAGKAIELMCNKVKHPEVLETWWHFVIWALLLPNCHRPEEALERQALRRAVGPVLVRGLVKLMAVAGMMALNGAVSLHENLWVSTLWMMFLTYFVFSGGADLLSLPTRLAGIEVPPFFNAPPLARNPREFWSRRWNLWFTDISNRLIFQPLGGSKRPVLAVSLVFLFSGVLHEYMTWVCLGAPDGRMTAFFLIHGAATLLTVKGAQVLKRKTFMPRALAIPLHITWFTLTAPLFFGPVNEAFTFHLWKLW